VPSLTCVKIPQTVRLTNTCVTQKCACHHSAQLLFHTFCAPASVQPVAPHVCPETSVCLHVKCPLSCPHLYAVLPTFSVFMATVLSIYPLVELRPFHRMERTLAVRLLFVRNKCRVSVHSQTAVLSFKPPVPNFVTINQRFYSCDRHH
jgi:hypothetical protein